MPWKERAYARRTLCSRKRSLASVEDACDQWIAQTDAVEPSGKVVLQKFYSVYRSLYPSLKMPFVLWLMRPPPEAFGLSL